ncbi:hypothetical protein C0389_00045 [bacterium]|nr:hypothetical protein [bacterium]
MLRKTRFMSFPNVPLYGIPYSGIFIWNLKDEVITLCNNAANWISEQTKQIPLSHQQEERFIPLEQCEYLGFQSHFYIRHYSNCKQD